MSNCLAVKCNNCLIGFICNPEVQPNDKRCKHFGARLKENDSKVISCNECDRTNIREGFIEVGFRYCPHCGRKLQRINKKKKI
jgi:tRNA U34 5-carboxymethylaminomethyl modifying enzyme MnmG/GidA